jgi:hypothetical protein
MKCISHVAAIIGLLATACDRCGDWNVSTSQICQGAQPQS